MASARLTPVSSDHKSTASRNSSVNLAGIVSSYRRPGGLPILFLFLCSLLCCACMPFRVHYSHDQGKGDTEMATKTRIVLPDGNGKDYETVLQHRVGDPVTWENSASHPGWRDGFNGYVVYDRHVRGDTVYLLIH